MKYRLTNLKLSKKLNQPFINNVRHASASLGLWESNMTNEIRHKIEAHWKDKILSEKSEPSTGEKYYVLSMFPYPSGSLHMGHVRVYAISDAVSRFHRLKGRDVIHPMGWDAFGLPAENAALERKIDPQEWTESNISNMKAQLKTLGCDFDWDCELATCHPEYYRWTQELFLKLFDRGLAYQKQSFVNWDPVDETVLADEQVDQNGNSWRSGAKVQKKLLKQWFIRTTAFAKFLMSGLDDPMLKEWRDIIKIQKHWIGECTGTSLDFKLITDLPGKPESFNVWTDRPEFIDQAKFVAVSKDNFLAKAKIKNFDDQDLETVFLDATVVNPFNNEELPLQQKRQQAMQKAREWKIGGYEVSPTLRDWLISRQRYWGTPIPIIHCKSCGTVPVPREQLPVTLPKKLTSDKGIPNLRQAVDWLKTSCPKCGTEAFREADTMDTFVDSSWYFMRYIDVKNTSEMFSKEKAKKFLPVDLYIGGKEHAALHLYYARFVNHFLHSEGLLPTREPFKQLLVQGMVMGKSFRVKGSGKYLKSEQVEKVGKNFVEKETKLPVVVTWEKMSKSKYNGVDPMEMFREYGADTTRLIMLADVAPTSTFQGIFNWQQRLWLTIRQFLKRRENISLEEVANTPTKEEFIKDDAYLCNSRNYYVKGVTFNIIGSQQLSVAISKMQGLTNSIRKVSLNCLTHSPEYEKTLGTQIIMLAPIAPRFASELWSGFCSAKYFLAEDFFMRDKDVLQQKWPVVDSDFELDLDVVVNGMQVDLLKIKKSILDQLTAEAAADLALQSPGAKKHIKNREILGFKYYYEQNCDGKVSFKVAIKPASVKVETSL
ncbi:Similar to LARS2: Probable leucine--tRNA ligase [Cotesia congregata]|uniref:leucine--tRNA ligase n=1 Tax=Cotesia congregata TaxID=51543 RepID=A0A8J2HBE9_COTCN|nr:Similar to LARS2: Probable leucine--tRNA ligase [Cotesia congregata]